jgi:monoamine oxidase
VKIGIIGAGANGYYAAWLLTQKGYTDITIFERNARVGGKCYSHMEAGTMYELGGVVIQPTSALNHDIARAHAELGLEDPLTNSNMLCRNTENTPCFSGQKNLIKLNTWQTFCDSLKRFQTWNLVKSLKKTAKITQGIEKDMEAANGHDDARDFPPEYLSLTLAQLSEKEGLQEYMKLWYYSMSCFGYGMGMDMPFIYWFGANQKTNRPDFDQEPPKDTTNFYANSMVSAPSSHGNQGIMETFIKACGSAVTLKLNAKVERVESVHLPGGTKVNVQATEGQHQFDYVIITAPHQCLDFLVTDDPETRTLLSEWTCHKLRVSVVRIPYLPEDWRGFHVIPESLADSCQQGHGFYNGMISLISAVYQTDCVLVYQLVCDSGSPETEVLDRALFEELDEIFQARAGENGVEVLASNLCEDYFPHYPIEKCRLDYPGRFCALNENHTGIYFSGVLADFESICSTCRVARRLVNTKF